jgi:hypothetical protein
MAYEEGKLNPKVRAQIAEETERLHLSDEDIRRLTQEARQAFEDRQREERQLTTAVVLDPKQHPELAYHQLRLLVSQLHLLEQAAGAQTLAQQIDPRDPQAAQIQRVLAAVSVVDSTQPPPSPTT